MNRFLLSLVLSRVKKALLSTGVVSLVAVAGFCYSPLPALAHHALGGNTPANALEGFRSGLAHPVIGLDHHSRLVGRAPLKQD